jgi:hypothetical protein
MRQALLVGIAAILALAACGREPAEVVFLHGRIYTLAGSVAGPLVRQVPANASEEPVAQAMAVRGGRVLAVGSDAEVQRLVGPGTAVHDLKGATVVPGLVDCHVHLANLGRSQREVGLVGTTSYEEIVERVRQRAATLPPGDWIGGRGWDQNDWVSQEFPDHTALSRVTPQNPVYLRRVDGHAALVNARALEISGVSAVTADPPGGRIVRRPDGSPTGVFVDAAMDLVTRHIPEPSHEERAQRMRLALQRAADGGLTGVHDAGMSASDYAVCEELLKAGELPIRVYAMVVGSPNPDEMGDLERALERGPVSFDPTQHLARRCVKIVMDGALGSRGAALLAAYSDAAGQMGLPQSTPEAFYAVAKRAHERGFQVATHCIGDAANRTVLDAYERLQRESPRPDARFRIEHAQVLALSDITRFAALGVLPSMQPTHCTSDMPWAPARLGPERVRGAYAWRSLRDTGVVIPCGSDAPVEAIEPLPGIYAAVTRQDAQGNPPEAWAAEQRLTRSEALRGFTTWAAFASFTEHDLGTLEAGKLADLTVLDRDILQVPAREILATHVVMTVVGGRVVHEVR